MKGYALPITRRTPSDYRFIEVSWFPRDYATNEPVVRRKLVAIEDNIERLSEFADSEGLLASSSHYTSDISLELNSIVPVQHT